MLTGSLQFRRFIIAASVFCLPLNIILPSQCAFPLHIFRYKLHYGIKAKKKDLFSHFDIKCGLLQLMWLPLLFAVGLWSIQTNHMVGHKCLGEPSSEDSFNQLTEWPDNAVILSQWCH